MKNRHIRKYWKCQCDCGSIINVEEYHLKSGHTTSCGHCHRMIFTTDLTGQQFGRLKVLEYKGIDKKGSYWKCQCSCGKIVICSADNLQRGKTKSCGCYRDDYKKINMDKSIHFVDGTCVEKIQAIYKNGICSNNRSGYRGVYQTENGKWRAQISFQGKKYNLGTFASIEDAKKARISAEKNLWGIFLDNYNNEKKKYQ